MTELRADYCNDKTLTIYRGFDRAAGTVYSVSGKKEARALAAKLGAKPWNF